MNPISKKLVLDDASAPGVRSWLVPSQIQRAGRQILHREKAVAFVVTAATATVPMVPPNDVDLGLHSLILHTKEYATLCDRYADRFLHHNPRPDGGPRDPKKVAASAHAMKAAGFMVFDDLWTVDGTNLAQCDADCGRPYGQA